MNWFAPAWATCNFELKRSFTFQRTAVTIVLALFPPTMLSLLVLGAYLAQRSMPPQMAEFSTFLTVFMVALVQLLSLLLWATPNIYSELEGKSWAFIASRPGGRVSVYLGKFMASVLVSFAIAMTAVTLCIMISHFILGTIKPVQSWLALNLVYLLASCIYSALFSTIGTLFIKRAMVVGAGFLIGFDVLLASVPGALVNKLTVRYHLQEIGVYLLGWFFPAAAGSEQEYRFIFGGEWPVWLHLLAIIGGTAFFLGLGIYIVVSREFVTKDQS